MKLINVDNEKVYYKKMLSSNEVAISDIANCYKRVEEVSATTCCSRSDFSMTYLVLVLKNQDKLKLEATLDEATDAIAKIQEVKPEVVVGYKKPN